MELFQVCFTLIFLIIGILFCFYPIKPSTEIVKKYGVPKEFFVNSKCYKTLFIRGQSLQVYVYDNLIVVLDHGQEYVFSKDFKDYKFYDSFTSRVFGFIAEGSEVQVALSKKQKRILEDFFCRKNDE